MNLSVPTVILLAAMGLDAMVVVLCCLFMWGWFFIKEVKRFRSFLKDPNTDKFSNNLWVDGLFKLFFGGVGIVVSSFLMMLSWYMCLVMGYEHGKGMAEELGRLVTVAYERANRRKPDSTHSSKVRVDTANEDKLTSLKLRVTEAEKELAEELERQGKSQDGNHGFNVFRVKKKSN